MMEESEAIERHDIAGETRLITPEALEGESLQDYLSRNGIEHFTARETLTMRRAGVVVDPPPREWWPRILPALRCAEMLRSICGHPLVIGNGFRPGALNKQQKGSSKSQHLYFRALDLDLPSKHSSRAEQERFYTAAVGLWLTIGHTYRMGLGLYAPRRGTRVHIDCTAAPLTAAQRAANWRKQHGHHKRRHWGGKKRGRDYVMEIAEGLR